VLVVGAGPCGLACAQELVAQGHDDIDVLEASDRPGGLASSVMDPAGFTWDRGGHVVFSHYGEFDRLLAKAMGRDVEHHERSSYVHVGGAWVPYPLQNNLHRLPAPMAHDALVGLIEAQQRGVTASSAEPDFGTWMLDQFGRGIVRQFMRPYNEKVWAYPPSALSSRWIAERVSTIDWRQALRTVITQVDDITWGPNNLFTFPSAGGTGEIYRRVAAGLASHVRYGAEVSGIDAEQRVVALSDGDEIGYDHLVWTGPLDRLVSIMCDPPQDVSAAAAHLVHNSVTVVGIGYEAPLHDDRSWLYFPDPQVPFYRATNFAKYAASNVPGGRIDRYSSWMTEIASSPWRPLDRCGLGERVDAALRLVGLVGHDAPVASVHVDHIPYAYPVPTIGRDAALRTIQPYLLDRSILARGRFGAWRYELGNMDHAVKMGVDAARRLLHGTPEQAWTL
jgi:UDP-galactopyranose mutase